MSAVIVSPEGAAIQSMVLAGPQEQSDQLPVWGDGRDHNYGRGI